MDIGEILNGSDARILMSSAVCYALLELHNDKELQKQVNNVLFNSKYSLLAKQLYIQTIMHDVNEELIRKFLKRREN